MIIFAARGYHFPLPAAPSPSPEGGARRLVHVSGNHVSINHFSISESRLDPGEKLEELVAKNSFQREFCQRELTIYNLSRGGVGYLAEREIRSQMVLRDSGEGLLERDRFIAGHAISVTNDSARDNTERFCFVFHCFFPTSRKD